MYNKREFALGTWWGQTMPWGLFVEAKVMCPDGRLRKVSRIASTADTFFSVPAAVKVKGLTVAGYVTVTTKSGLSTPTKDDPSYLAFVAYKNGKNYKVFAGMGE